MYNKQVKEIVEDLKRTKKAIISLGCSFTQGQGAINDELFVTHNWTFEKLGKPLSLNNLTEEQKEELCLKYKCLEINPHTKEIDWTFMEYENAFVNVLCKKYLESSYTSINLGLRGCGNRATIKELYLYPEIDFHKLDEIIVIYGPSGLERFDFSSDWWNDHHKWKCMWPHYKDIEPGPRKTLWEGYNRHLYSDKFEVVEQILHAQELLSWCHNHNAELIITPGFDIRYNKDYFLSVLTKEYRRTMEGDIEETNVRANADAVKLLNLFPWNKMFLPDGCPTFVDLAMKQEHPDDYANKHFFEYLGTGSPNLWITACAHPSAKGHDLFAKFLNDRIKEL